MARAGFSCKEIAEIIGVATTRAPLAIDPAFRKVAAEMMEDPARTVRHLIWWQRNLERYERADPLEIAPHEHAWVKCSKLARADWVTFLESLVPFLVEARDEAETEVVNERFEMLAARRRLIGTNGIIPTR